MVHDRDPVYPLSYLQCTWMGLEKMGLAAILGISSLVLWPTVMIFCSCLLPEMVYKTYYNFVKSMPRTIIFPFQQIQIHPNPNPNVFILLVDVTDNRWRSSLIIRSCPGTVRLTILAISFMNQVHKIYIAERLEVPTLDHLLIYWEFFISAHHCKSNLLCKLIVVPFMEAIFGTFSEYFCQIYRSWNTTVKVCWILPQPTHTYFVKNFPKELNSVRVILLRRFAEFAQSILHSWNPSIWQVGSISAYSLQYDFGRNISNISDEFSL